MRLRLPKPSSLRWLCLLALCALVVMYAAGAFGGARVAPGEIRAEERLPAPPAIATAKKGSAPIVEEIFGTVRSRRRVSVASELAARVIVAPPEAGRSVKKGDVLAKLDSSDFEAAVGEARAAQSVADSSIARFEESRREAEAVFARAESERARVAGLFEQKAATAQELESSDAELARSKAAVAGAEASVATARAEVARAAQVVARAELALARTSIAAPFDGVVSERSVEVGDLAAPGRVLCSILDPDALRVEANVRESRLEHAELGSAIEVRIDASSSSVQGKIAEILPSGDSASRSFEVRVDLPDRSAARPGMFARLELRVGDRDVIQVPRRAVVRVGQLETVVLRDGERWTRRLVTTGKVVGRDDVEVLSGLVGGESIGIFGGEIR